MTAASRFIADGLDWSGLTGRARFALAAALAFAGIVITPEFAPLSIGESLGFVLTAPALLLFLGHTRRRLRALNWSGWLIWLLAVPLANAVLVVLLALRKTRDTATEGPYRRAGLILAGLIALTLLSRLFWHPFIIPAGSMKPALRPGDYVIATRSFTPPDRGDITFFTHPVTGQTYVKRVIGIGGDVVQITREKLYLNGTRIPTEPLGTWTEPMAPSGPNGVLPQCGNPDAMTTGTCEKTLLSEQLPGEATPHQILDFRIAPSRALPATKVPDGHLFLMGDNRDNSLDSRFPQTVGGLGTVPAALVLARPALVIGWPDVFRRVR